MSCAAEIIPFTLCYTIIIPLGLVICVKLYYNLKNEEHKIKGKVIQRILKNYCLVQCVAWPLLSAVFGIVFFTRKSIFAMNHSILMLIIVAILRFSFRLNVLYVGFSSFILAICRYVFTKIVTHDEPTCIRKLRRLFIVVSVLVPVILAILDDALTAYPLEAPIKVTAIEHNLTHVESAFNLQNHTYLIPQSALYLVVDKYVSSSIKYGFNLGLLIAHIAFYSNIPEGILYTLIFISNKRYTLLYISLKGSW